MNKTRCRQCRQLMKYASEMAGRQAKCPRCGEFNILPRAQSRSSKYEGNRSGNASKPSIPIVKDFTISKSLLGSYVAAYPCPSCGAVLRSKEAELSHDDECPQCGRAFRHSSAAIREIAAQGKSSEHKGLSDDDRSEKQRMDKRLVIAGAIISCAIVILVATSFLNASAKHTPSGIVRPGYFLIALAAVTALLLGPIYVLHVLGIGTRPVMTAKPNSKNACYLDSAGTVRSTMEGGTAAADLAYEFHGVGGVLRVYEGKLTITPKGTMGFLTKGMKGTKSIPYSSITGIQFKEAGAVFSGYLQFTILGGVESAGGLFDAASDENTFMYAGVENNEFAIEVNRYIETAVANARVPSSAAGANGLSDELQKLASMKEQGLLSEDEFRTAKEKLIS